LDSPQTTPTVEGIEDKVRGLSPQNDTQRALQSRALQIINDVLQRRWLTLASADDSVPVPFLVVLVFWLTIIFVSFGLFAPANTTVVAVLLVSALSVAGSTFLIVEMGHPYEGLIKVSSAPLRYAYAHIGQ